MTADLLLHDFMLLDADYAVQEHMSVAINGDTIIKVAPAEELADTMAEQMIYGNGKLLMPGLTDAHTHSCQQLLRGSLADEYPMIWLRILVPYESALSEDDVYASAKLYCLQAIKAGITSFAESGGRHMHKVAAAAIESGMRAAISRSMIDSGSNITPEMLEATDEAIEKNDALFDVFHGAENGRIQIYYGMRQVMTCTPRLVRLAAEHAAQRNTGVHAHLCEHRDEVSFCLQNYKMRPAEYLDSQGMLGPRLLTAHNVTLSEEDILLLAKRNVKLVHCPFANLINHGFSKTPRLLHTGCSIGMGSDGAAYNTVDLFEEMRVLRAAMIAQWGLPVFDPKVLTVQQTLDMAIRGGAAALGCEDTLGKIEEGRKADLITIQMRQAHILPTNNFTTAILDCVSARDVEDSIIDGRIVMRDRKVLTLQEEDILDECTERMSHIRSRVG